MKRLVFFDFLLCFALIFFLYFTSGCLSTKIITDKNVNTAMELLLNAEQLSKMDQADDWRIRVIVENEFGRLTFYGNGNSVETAGKDLTKNAPELGFKPIITTEADKILSEGLLLNPEELSKEE